MCVSLQKDYGSGKAMHLSFFGTIADDRILVLSKFWHCPPVIDEQALPSGMSCNEGQQASDGCIRKASLPYLKPQDVLLATRGFVGRALSACIMYLE